MRARLAEWKNRVLGVREREPHPIVLSQGRIFILPTYAGLALGGCLLLMLVGSVNYAVSLGFALTFLLGSMAIVSILHTFRNLVGLKVVTGRCNPVFAGEMACFPLALLNERRHTRYAIQLRQKKVRKALVDVPGQDEIEAVIAIPAERRGYFYPGRVTIETRFPLGWVRAWSHIAPAHACLVYPAPEKDPPPLPWGTGEAPGGVHSKQGSDDFSGLRDYQPSDSPRHIAWKSVGRGSPLVTKQFSGDGDGAIWLDWSSLPPNLDTEARLSRLTSWVIAAQRQGVAFGLRLPGRECEPDTGEFHFHDCLRALAFHGQAGA